MKIFISIMFLWGVSIAAHAQIDKIIGENPVIEGDVEDYQYEGFVGGGEFYWETNGGTISSPGFSGNVYSCTITWHTAGDHSLKLYLGSRLDGILVSETTITVEEFIFLPPPLTPDDPKLGTNPTCGPKRIDRVGTPPDNVKWYWQSSENGESIDLGFGSIYNATSSGTYYLRARNVGNGEAWSVSSSEGVSVTINPIPLKPTEPTINFYQDGVLDQLNCYSRGEIVKPSAPNGITYYWQGTDMDGENADDTESDIYTFDRNGTYYLRARDNFSLCWSESLAIEAQIVGAYKPLPPIIAQEICGQVTLDKQIEPRTSDRISTIRTYWQGTVEYGTSTGMIHSANTYRVTESGRYYLRAYDPQNNCWGIPSYIDVVVNVPGVPPSPVQDRQCGMTTLTRPAPDGDVNYYWQMSPGGRDTESEFSTADEHIFTSDDDNSVYMAGVNSEGCWGQARVIHAEVNELLEVTTPDIAPLCNEVQVALLYREPHDLNKYRIVDENGEEVDSEGGDDDPLGPLWWKLTKNGVYSLEIDDPHDVLPCKDDPVEIVVEGLNIRTPVDAGPDISGFANGSVITLSGVSHTGGTWSGTGIVNPEANEFDPAGLAEGNYTITYNYMNAIGCTSSDSRVITLLGAPTIMLNGSEYIMPGNKVELFVDNLYNAYQWKKNGVNISGANSHNYFATQPGDYTVTTTAAQLSVETSPVTINDAREVVDQNFVRTYTFNIDNVQLNDNLFSLSTGDLTIKTDYSDGLGRPLQSVSSGQSPNCFDMVLPFEYQYGRQPKEYLPYIAQTSDGLFKSDALNRIDYIISKQYEFYQTADKIEHTSYPYVEKDIDTAPSAKVYKQSAPGAAWRLTGSNYVAFGYTSNRSSDNLKYWRVENELPVMISEYAPNDAFLDVFRDEDHHLVMTYTNRAGQVILKKVQAVENPDLHTYISGEWAVTYYVYDDLGNLRFVLPPEFNEAIAEPITYPYSPTIDLLNNWAFQYKYDHRKRMIEKKVPGAAKVYLVYDFADQLVLTQDGNQRLENKWSFTKYDFLKRPILTGETVITGTLQTISDMVNPSVVTEFPGNAVHGYTNSSYPRVSNEGEYLTVTYYDNYNFLNQTDFGNSYEFDPDQLDNVAVNGKVYPFPDQEHNLLIGHVTGAKTKSLSSGNWLRTVSYYDKRYRVVQVIAQNHIGGIDKSSTIYNFPGWVLKTRTTHEFPGKPELSTERRYEYDHAGRLLRGYHQLFEDSSGNGEVLLAENHYNELGELIEKNLHVENGTSAQSVDYRYNIRGWLKSINSGSLQIVPGINEEDPTTDYFGMDLFYHQNVNGVSTSN